MVLVPRSVQKPECVLNLEMRASRNRTEVFIAYSMIEAQLIFRISFTIPPPSTAKRGGIVKRLLNTCIAHSNSADLLLSNNASDWLSGDFDNKNQ